ncbi:RnfABCDGE type electron transport complex subunit G [Wenzhouxiangella sp. XN201]|uniref:RnfABCDGE type electron transport complex subunit G n=1 Tax=Wenzhouxiangella sp. XN201 TaxID=2710755 RepID=UPI0013CBF5E3|nr:RnfABCDGE type electron transport complex subunit G [Wenzhouxiangella sp. XN201]NEZ04201.1 RnfABCDGE type electron transport complex subunit G [Wenzhouxiangella sp. XN201]
MRLNTLRPALILAGLGLAAAVLLAGLDQFTRERIADERQQRALAAVSAMLGEIGYDNDLLDDTARLGIPDLAEPAVVYRARQDGKPVAVVMDVVTSAGYSGDIRLLIAADVDGTVLGVRVVEHRETPGLGDKIERRRSDWIEQFDGRSLVEPPAEDWAPDRRDGAFDTLTSATITSAAVVDAVKRALQAFESGKGNLFATTENTEGTE